MSSLSGYSYDQYHWLPVALMVSCLSVSGLKPAMARAGSCSANRSANEGTAMPTRMRIGTIVHNTSIRVLWLVRDGTGLARALKRTMT